MEKFQVKLAVLEKKPALWAASRKAVMEFHINRDVRRAFGLRESLFSLTGNVVLADLKQTRELAAKFNAKQDPAHPERFVRAGYLRMGLIDEILHYVVALYRQQVRPDAFDTCLARLENKLGGGRTQGNRIIN